MDEKKIELFGSYDQSLYKPLTGRVTYQLCGLKPVVEPQESGMARTRLACPTLYLPNTYIHTTPNGETHMMEYYVSRGITKLANGDSVVVPKRGIIVIGRREAGEKTLDPKNPLDRILFTFLELHPLNEANGGAGFRKIDGEALMRKEYEREKSSYDANKAIYDMKASELNITCRGFLLNFDSPLDKIDDDAKRFALLKVAKEDPKRFLMALREQDFELRSVIKNAEDMQIITWNESKDSWMLNQSGEIFHAKMPALDRYESIVEYVNSTKKGELALEKLKNDIARLNPTPVVATKKAEKNEVI